MKQKTKVLTIILLSVVAGALVYLPLAQTLESSEEIGYKITLA
jgi:hypothetical protein